MIVFDLSPGSWSQLNFITMALCFCCCQSQLLGFRIRKLFRLLVELTKTTTQILLFYEPIWFSRNQIWQSPSHASHGPERPEDAMRLSKKKSNLVTCYALNFQKLWTQVLIEKRASNKANQSSRKDEHLHGLPTTCSKTSQVLSSLRYVPNLVPCWLIKC